MVIKPHKFLLLLLLCIVFIVPAVSGYDENAMTKIFEYTMLTGQVTQVAQTDYGTINCAGMVNGNISCYDQSGVFLWRIQLNSSIKKLIINPGGARFVAQTWNNYIYYGDVTTGTVQAAFNGAGLPWYGIAGWNITDIDISRDGAYWGFATTHQIRIMDSTNTTVVSRDTNSTMLATYGNYNKFQLDPDKTFYVVSYDASSRLDHYKIDNASAWYQGYNYRVRHTITGSVDGYLENWNRTFIYVYNTTGANSGPVVYIGENVTQPDFDDIRFVDANNNQLLNSHVNAIGANYVNFSVLFDNLTASEVRPIYVYYGNASASAYSNTTVVGVVDRLGTGLFSIPNSTFNWNFEDGSPLDWILNGYSSLHATEGVRSGYIYSAVPYSAGCGAAGESMDRYFYLGASGVKGINGTTTGHGFDFTYDAYLSCGGYSPGASDDSYAWIYDPRTGAVKCSLHCSMTDSQTATCLNVNGSYTGSADSKNNQSMAIARTYAVCYYGANANAYVYIDNLRFFSNRSITAPPVHGGWADVENIYHSTFMDTYSATGTITFMDLPWNNPYLVADTATYVYQLQIDSTGFGTVYSILATGTPGSPYDVKTSDSGTYFLEGRGSIADIYRLGATKVATFSTGNNINQVSISTADSLWSVVGSMDGRWYVFSKAGQSTWYLYWASTSGSVPNSVSIDGHGSIACVGYASANFTCYSTTAVPTTPSGSFYITVHVLKDDNPYITNCTLSNGEYDASIWTFVRTTSTDTRGNFVFEAFPTKYYKVRCGTENAESIIYATNTLTDYYISIKTQMVSQTVSSSGTYDSGTNTIDMAYNDGALDTTSVTFRIIDSGNYTEVYNQTFASNSVSQSWSVPAGYTDRTYKVDCVAVRGTGTLHNMWIVRPSGAMATNLPIDTNMSNAICVIFLMVLSGLFGRVHSARGGIIVVGFFAFFIYMGWMTVPWWAAAPIIVFAFVYGLIKAAPG